MAKCCSCFFARKEKGFQSQKIPRQDKPEQEILNPEAENLSSVNNCSSKSRVEDVCHEAVYPQYRYPENYSQHQLTTYLETTITEIPEEHAVTIMGEDVQTFETKNKEELCWKLEEQPKESTSTPAPLLAVYDARQLFKATRKFSPKNLLGRGGFGNTYKGVLKDPITNQRVNCAVKRLDQESHQGHREWLAEIETLGRFVHPNLVKLLGFCGDEREAMLVYEFVGGKSLDFHLFESPKPLSWHERLKIGRQTAAGLSFLHSHNVVHRDFKAPNVLLDEAKNVKISDFGLAREIPNGQSHVSTSIILGTLGYLDPQFHETGRLTRKSDVFSFGVLLFELLTGRRAAGMRGEPSLLATCRSFFKRRNTPMLEFVDPHIRDEVEARNICKLVKQIALVALWCTDDKTQKRPTMSEVCDTLDRYLSTFSL